MSDYSDEALDRACEADVQDCEQFRVELRDAIWLAVRGGLDMASILGDVRRVAVEVAKDQSNGSKKRAQKLLAISRTTMHDIETHRHKF